MEDFLERIKTQKEEFKALDNLIVAYKSLNQVPIVDDDYPEARHTFESALSSYIKSMKDNGRFKKGNFHKIVEVQ